ncbi:hypothetical protein [Rhizobium sp. BK376]|uniref:hypothetical protein n=1 Tax=Rhizobium sp. BK376 TaxID=2512149 RepID=UPI00104422CD|nr:hypothetical protein [Rhizobium sp. BK376]TCR75586.1 hypothetical protein EV561_12225 [Rhizobium sp. BK376]
MAKGKSPAPNETSGAMAPTIGEIEGRLLVLEMVAGSAAARLLSLHDSNEKAALVAAILADIELSCRSKGLHFRDILDAQGYAEELLADAQLQADGLDDIKHAYLHRKHD